MSTIEQYKTIFISQPTGDGGKLIQNNFKTLADLNEISVNNIQSISGNLNTEIENRTTADNILNSSLNTEIENRTTTDITLQSNIDAIYNDGSLIYTSSVSGSILRTQKDRNSDFIHTKDFGAKFDGVTDDTTSIQKALDYAGNNSVGRVFLPSGTANISATLTYKKGISVEGSGKRNTILKATENFNGAYMLMPGDENGMAFDNFISHLWVHCNDISGLSGIKYTSAQEGCGTNWGVLITNFRQYGIDLTNSPANCYINDIEIYGSKLGSICGISILHGSEIYINKATILGDNNAGERTLSTGIRIELSDTIIGMGWHFETCEDGVLCIGDNVSGVVNGINSNTAGTGANNLIRFTGAPRMVFNSIQRNNANVAIKNDYGAMTITNPFIQSSLALTPVVDVHFDISTTGSPLQYYNNTPHTLVIYVIGGTVSLVTVVGRSGDSIQTIGTGPGMYIIVPGELIEFTYSSAPTIKAFPI